MLQPGCNEFHSTSDTLINWLFNVLLVGLVYSTIGYFTEKHKV